MKSILLFLAMATIVACGQNSSSSLDAIDFSQQNVRSKPLHVVGYANLEYIEDESSAFSDLESIEVLFQWNQIDVLTTREWNHPSQIWHNLAT